VVRTLNATGPEARAALKVLWTSKPYTPHAIATARRIDDATRAAVLQAMLHANEDPNAKKLLQGIAFKGFEPGADTDWNDIRALDLGNL